MRYTVIIGKGEKNYGAYVPDLPGCVAVGETKEEILKLIREAIEFHIDGIQKECLRIPEPTTTSELIEV